MKKLKAVRTLAGLSQKKIAKMIGISETQYRAKENQKFKFTVNEAEKIISILRGYNLNYTVEEIFFESKPTYTDVL